MRRATFLIGMYLGEVLVAEQIRTHLAKNPEHRVRFDLVGHLRGDVHQVPLILPFAHYGRATGQFKKRSLVWSVRSPEIYKKRD